MSNLEKDTQKGVDSRRSKLITFGAATLLAMSGLLTAGCSSTSAKPSPRAIEACPAHWPDQANKVSEQTKIHATMQAGKSILIQDIEQAEHDGRNGPILVMAVPAKYAGPASLVLKEGNNPEYYDANLADTKLSTPAEEFCEANNGLHETPAFVAAAAALNSSGITVKS